MSGFSSRPHIAWAGVALRMSDGTMQTFELDGRLDHVLAEIEVVEPGYRDSFGLLDRVYLPPQRIRIQIEGGYTTWRRFDESSAAGPAAQVEGRRTLPAGGAT